MPFEYPSKEAFVKLLGTLRHAEIVEKYLLVEETPFAFRDKKKGYEFLLKHLGTALGVGVDAITVVGSGRIGFSLSPFKFGRPFSKRSDLDIAVIDSRLFDTAWLDMVGLGSKFARLDRDVQNWVNEHRSNNVYWGYVEPGKLRGAVACHQIWFPTFAGLAQYEYFADRLISGRLYRTWDHARSHQLYTLSKISLMLGSQGVTQ